jgi:steroid Delta-isomerase
MRNLRGPVACEAMPSKDAVTQTVKSYLEFLAEGSADDILTLYAEDATIEDPVGSDLRRGHEAIREFYTAFQDADKQTELLELRVSGSEAAFLWQLTLNAGQGHTTIAPISHMTFDDDARIIAMRAFWSPDDVR